MLNPNFIELGEISFQMDGSINLDIKSCLNCRYFKSYQQAFNNPDEPSEFGLCGYPFMLIDETVGLGLLCDLYSFPISESL